MNLQLDGPLEQLLRDVASLDREQCARELHQIQRPRVDLDDAFIAAQSTDQLRHILLAACLRARRHLPLKGSGAIDGQRAAAPCAQAAAHHVAAR